MKPGTYIPQIIATNLERYLERSDIDKISEVTEIETDEMVNMIYQEQIITEKNAVVLWKLISCAEQNARDEIQISSDAIALFHEIKTNLI